MSVLLQGATSCQRSAEVEIRRCLPQCLSLKCLLTSQFCIFSTLIF